MRSICASFPGRTNVSDKSDLPNAALSHFFMFGNTGNSRRGLNLENMLDDEFVT